MNNISLKKKQFDTNHIKEIIERQNPIQNTLKQVISLLTKLKAISIT